VCRTAVTPMSAPRCLGPPLPQKQRPRTIPIVACWLVETRLRGWGRRTRTQKCRGKISL
jgi:hypothetical protein